KGIRTSHFQSLRVTDHVLGSASGNRERRILLVPLPGLFTHTHSITDRRCESAGHPTADFQVTIPQGNCSMSNPTELQGSQSYRRIRLYFHSDSYQVSMQRMRHRSPESNWQKI